MSNKSIIITEKQIVDDMDEMCCESLDPSLYDTWEKVVNHIVKIRPGLANYPFEIFPGTLDSLNKLGAKDKP